MNNRAKKLLAILLAALMLVSVLLSACQNDETDTESTAATERTEPSPTEPQATDAPDETETVEEWDGFKAACFSGEVEDFEGTVADETFTGVVFKSSNYQPSVHFTKDALKSLRTYARENGYDAVRIHAYAKQTNNLFLIAGRYIPLEEWTTFDLGLGELYTFTQFWSQSEGTTENYLWFELVNLPVINATCFTKGIDAFSGTVGGKQIDGFVFKSADYQPYAYFNDWAIEDIKAYAEKNGYNALRVSVYPIQKDNVFILGGQPFSLNRWATVDFSIADMTPENMWMWSQSQGLTENYMTFEFVNSDHPVKPSTTVYNPNALYNTTGIFTSKGNYGTYKYSGKVGGQDFTGYRLRSTEYQPFFYLTDKGVNTIRGEAEAAGANMVRVYVYPILLDNAFICGPGYCANNMWTTVELPIESINTEMAFWSQSQGVTDVYLRFEYFYLNVPAKIGPINASFFEQVDLPIGFSDYKGEVGGVTLNGVYAKSADYQPHFRFTANGIQQIRDWAKANGYNILRIHSYARLYNNGFVAGSDYCPTDQWNTTEIFIEDLNEDYLFWSQSEGVTEIWMWFDYSYLDVPEKIGPIDASFFKPLDLPVAFSNYRGEVEGTSVNGVYAKSVDYQPHFRFTAEGLKTLKAWAAENNYNILRLHSYAKLYDNAFVVGSTYCPPDQWNTTEIFIDDLSESFDFWSQSQGVTEIWMWFDYSYLPIPAKDHPIDASFFEGAGSAISSENYRGEIAGTTINGVKIKSADYQPYFKFTEAGLKTIQEYAAANGKNFLRVHVYAELLDNGFVIGKTYCPNKQWYAADVPVSDLTSDFRFWSQSQGVTNIWMWFEFDYSTTYEVNPFGQPLHARSFTGAGVAFADYQGEAGGENITGVKVTSAVYQPYFYLTQEAVDSLKSSGKTTLTIHAYAILYDNAFVIGGSKYIGIGVWDTATVNVADLSTAFSFWSQSQGTTEIYLWFELS